MFLPRCLLLVLLTCTLHIASAPAAAQTAAPVEFEFIAGGRTGTVAPAYFRAWSQAVSGTLAPNAGPLSYRHTFTQGGIEYSLGQRLPPNAALAARIATLVAQAQLSPAPVPDGRVGGGSSSVVLTLRSAGETEARRGVPSNAAAWQALADELHAQAVRAMTRESPAAASQR